MGAFYDCATTEVIIPDSVTSIATFDDSFNFGEGVGNPFQSRNLSKITVSPDNAAFCSVDGILFSKDMQHIFYFPAAKQDSVYKIPDGVTEIGVAAFKDCSLRKIFVPDSVTVINDYAFFGCSNIVEITVPESVVYIGTCAFYLCDHLTQITLPTEMTELGEFAFGCCEKLKNIRIPAGINTLKTYLFTQNTSLKTIDIPTSVTAIEDEAFLLCPALKNVNYAGSEAQWSAIVIGTSNEALTSAAIHFNS